MPDSRILNPSSLILDLHETTLWISQELFLICSWVKSLKTLPSSIIPVNKKSVLKSKLDLLCNDKPWRLSYVPTACSQYFKECDTMFWK